MALVDRPATQTKTISVAICGNPNCGKTTIFNALTGLRQKVANYPGVTVERTSGQFRIPHDSRSFTIVDIPGAYSLSAFSPDESVAVQALLGGLDDEHAPEVIINVIDVTNLERALYLLFQIMQIGKPVVVGLNMMDLADKRGLSVDTARMSEELGGIPVVPMVGSRGRGITALKRAVAKVLEHPPETRDFYHAQVGRYVDAFAQGVPNGHRSRAEYLRILMDVGGPAEKKFLREGNPTKSEELARARRGLIEEFGSLTAAETHTLAGRATQFVERVVHTKHSASQTRSEKLDRVMLHPFLGPAILVAIMGLMFQSIFSWAEPLMTVIDSVFGSLAAWVGAMLPAGPIQSLIVDGVIGGVGSVLVFLPQIIILFLFIAVLEDSGYMPRVAFLVDRVFRWCGLSGKSFIPLLSSFACGVPGIMATRVIEDKKLRIITIMVAPLMTCSARLPVYAIMIAAFIPSVPFLGIFTLHGVVLATLYLLGLVVAVVVSLILKKTILKTQRGTFMMEMPSYKIPTVRSVVIRVLNRAQSFVVRAGTTILAITILIWALSYYPRSPEVTAAFDEQVEAAEQTFAARFALINSEIESRAVADGQEVARFAEARLGMATSEEEISEARAELSETYPDHAGIVELHHFKRVAEVEHDRDLAALSNARAGAQLRSSYLGKIGQAVEPVFRPLGWDWKITMATLASFPAREVIIATLGTIYNLGSEVETGSSSLVDKMRGDTWESGSQAGQRVFSPAVALSVMIFFALCCQCGATVVTIKQETGGWRYAVGVFVYMTVLAYAGAFVVYQVFSRLGW